MSDVPEYYRHLAEPPTPEVRPEKRSPAASERLVELAPLHANEEFRGNTFTLGLPEGWRDRTVYILGGPVTDGIQHNVTITVDYEPAPDRLADFAEMYVRTLEEELRSCRLLHRLDVQLESGIPAHRAIFVWYPDESLRLYQEQIYVLHGDTGFVLTASFTKKTRRTLGPEVERMMLSFSPDP